MRLQQGLCFFQTQTGNFTYNFNHTDFVVASGFKNDVKAVFSSTGAAATAAAAGAAAETPHFLPEVLQISSFHNSQSRKVFYEFSKLAAII